LYQELLGDHRLIEFQLKVDKDLAEEVAAGGCACHGVLHRANYERKPRGGRWGLSREERLRFSFCCAREGCRKRVTPPSVRFLGRKVYLEVIVILAVAMRHGSTPRRVGWIREHLGVSGRTLKRWRKWWSEIFTSTAFWKRARGLLQQPVEEGKLPHGLMEQFEVGAGGVDRLIDMLKFLSPITGGGGLGLRGN
jgi:hypothetical protein